MKVWGESEESSYKILVYLVSFYTIKVFEVNKKNRRVNLFICKKMILIIHKK